MLFLEAFDIAEPADGVADGADRKLDHYFFVFRIEIMGEDRFPATFFMDDEPETDIKLLDAGYIGSGNGILAEENNPRIDIGECDMILFLILREKNADTVVEVELNPLNRIQSRNLRHFSVNRLLVHLLPLSQFLTCGQIRLGGIDADILRRRIVIRRYGKIIHLKTPD